MSYFVSFLLAIVSAMLIHNVVLARFYGICSASDARRETIGKRSR